MELQCQSIKQILGSDEESLQKKAEKDAKQNAKFAEEEDAWRLLWRLGFKDLVLKERSKREAKLLHEKRIEQEVFMNVTWPIAVMMIFG